MLLLTTKNGYGLEFYFKSFHKNTKIGEVIKDRDDLSSIWATADLETWNMGENVIYANDKLYTLSDLNYSVAEKSWEDFLCEYDETFTNLGSIFGQTLIWKSHVNVMFDNIHSFSVKHLKVFVTKLKTPDEIKKIMHTDYIYTHDKIEYEGMEFDHETGRHLEGSETHETNIFQLI